MKSSGKVAVTRLAENEMSLDWTNPIPLKSYGSAPRGPGIYAIGEPIDQAKPVTPCDDYDAYFGLWPDNLRPVYVGISESNGQGVRGRLSSHARGKGNKFVAERIQAGLEMWFITISGKEVIEYEALFMCLKTTGQFEGNQRAESARSARRHMQNIRREMGQAARAFYDYLDMGEHGEGM